MDSMFVTDRTMRTSFLFSLGLHTLVLTSFPGTVSYNADCGRNAKERAISIGSLQATYDPPVAHNTIVAPPQKSALHQSMNRQDESTLKKVTDQHDDQRAMDLSVARHGIQEAAGKTEQDYSPLRQQIEAPLPARGQSGRSRSSGGGGPENYFSMVRKKIAEVKCYPAEALNEGSHGTAIVGFELHRDGSVSHVHILRSSLSGILDTEAQGTVRRAAPFPPVPDNIKGDSLNIQVPISFEIVRR